jgi:hypothetical protein
MINFKTIKPDDQPGLTAVSGSREFRLGQTVYLKLKTECCPGMIVGITTEINGSVHYSVRFPNTGPESGCYFAAELTTEFEPSFS